MTRCCTGEQYCKPVDEPPVILGLAHMVKTVPDRRDLHPFSIYDEVPSHTWIDTSLDELPLGPDPIQIFSVYGEWKQWTVTKGRYRRGAKSGTCAIQYSIWDVPYVYFIEAWYCRHCGKLLEDCNEHQESRWLTGRAHNPRYVRVMRRPRLALRLHPFYRHPVIQEFYRDQYERIDPTEEEIENRFYETFCNDNESSSHPIDQLLGEEIPVKAWTQTPHWYLRDDVPINRKCNRDLEFVYVRDHYVHEVLYRAKVLRISTGLSPDHDVISYVDFDEQIKNEISQMLTPHDVIPVKPTILVEGNYCPEHHVTFETDHNCTFSRVVTGKQARSAIGKAHVCRVDRLLYSHLTSDGDGHGKPSNPYSKRPDDTKKRGPSPSRDEDDDNDDEPEEMTEELGSHQRNAVPLVEEMRYMRKMILTAYLVVRMRTLSHRPRRKQRA